MPTSVDGRQPDRSGLAASTRLAGMILAFGGISAIASGWLIDGQDAPVALRAGFGFFAMALGIWLIWYRPSLAGYGRGLAAVSIAYGLIITFEWLVGLTPYGYPVLFILVAVWIGLTRERLFPWVSAPLLVLAYLLPKLDEPVAIQTSAVTVPICLLIAEVISRTTHRLDESRQRLAEQARLFRSVAGAARSISALDMKAVVPQILEAIRGVGFDAAGLNELDRERGVFRVLASSGIGSDLEGREMSLDQGLTGAVLSRERYAIWRQGEGGDRTHEELVRRGLQTVVAVPVFIDGTIRAVLLAGQRDRVEITEHDIEAMEILAFEAGVALQNAAHFERRSEDIRLAEDRALKDHLTGLGNRRLVDQLLDRIAPGDVLMLIDLDHFKWVNDRFGHDQGDALLASTGQFFRDNLRDGDLATRYGGEEFLLYLPGLNGRAGELGNRLLEAWREDEPITTFSVGAAEHRVEESGPETLKRADQALYRAKHEGRNRLVQVN